MWRETLAKPSLAVTATFDEDGRLWTAAIRDRRLYVSHSGDRGARWSAPVRVNPEPENILGDGENRPKIVVRKGVVYVAYTQGLEKPMTGNIRFSRSTDGGKTFAPPVTVNDNHDIISHRFESLAVDDNGEAHVVWLDKRDLHAAQARHVPYRGAALYYAVSRDGASAFGPNRKLADHTCECCRIALARDTDGVPVALWRHVFDQNTRDHALLRLDGTFPLVRASHDDWHVDGCPHHGPALSIGPNGVYHLAWFTGAPGRAGLHYRRSHDRGKSFTAPVYFGNPDAQPGRPQVLSLGRRVVLAWKEFDGSAGLVRATVSRDGGAHWSAPVTHARSAGASDHPQLLSDRGRVFLGWQTANEGFRLFEVAP